MIAFPNAILLIEDDSDRAFMERLYLNYSKLMYAVAMKRLSNPQDAEDAVHEAILRLMKKISLLKQKNSYVLRRYIVVTIDRVSIDLAIKKGRHPFTAIEEDFIESIEDTNASVEDLVMIDIEHEELIKALRQLPQREQNILRWKYYELWPNEEIAQALGIKKNSVRKYLMNARRLLKAILEEKQSE
ncbi:MAG: RNA polymerase sigma factor [Christensenellales bacterium]|jgi:RNA polymerase sigma-70 factor (ECF subfamily)